MYKSSLLTLLKTLNNKGRVAKSFDGDTSIQATIRTGGQTVITGLGRKAIESFKMKYKSNVSFS